MEARALTSLFLLSFLPAQLSMLIIIIITPSSPPEASA
jgi:hypothetical protein